MSIRAFSTQPCETCQCDTVHVAMKCRECGTIVKTGGEQRRDRFKGKMAQLTKVYGPQAAVEIVQTQARAIAFARNDWKRRNGLRAVDLPTGALEHRRKAGR